MVGGGGGRGGRIREIISTNLSRIIFQDSLFVDDGILPGIPSQDSFPGFFSRILFQDSWR